MGAGATVALAFGMIIIYGLMIAAIAYSFKMATEEEEVE